MKSLKKLCILKIQRLLPPELLHELCEVEHHEIVCGIKMYDAVYESQAVIDNIIDSLLEIRELYPSKFPLIYHPGIGLVSKHSTKNARITSGGDLYIGYTRYAIMLNTYSVSKSQRMIAITEKYKIKNLLIIENHKIGDIMSDISHLKHIKN